MRTPVRHIAATAGLVLALTPSFALAQDAATCSVNLYQPTVLAQAQIQIQKAANAPEGEAGAQALRDAGRLLQDARRFVTNPNGYAFAKAQVYILWLHQDTPKDKMTLAELNMGRDRTTTVDLVQSADSLLTIVETADASCIPETDRWRQSRPWNTRIGHAYRLIQANQIDSAEYWAKEAYRLDRRSPFVYNAFAQIASRRGDEAELRAQLEKAIELADQDTALVTTAAQLRTQYATSLQNAAIAEPDMAKKKEMLGRAGRMFLQVGMLDPSGSDGPAYISAALDAAALAQDTALVAEIVTPMLEDPSPYPDLSLLLGAETSRLLNRDGDAITLYKSALEKNPNIRDGNYFLAFLYLNANKPAEAEPLLARLVDIDPSNPDNVTMRAMAVRLMADADPDAAKKRTLTRQADSLTREEQNMPHRVAISRFERKAEGATLVVEIENRGTAARTYALEVAFLDAEGNVVETVSGTSASADPNGTPVRLQLVATKPGIVAYKYKALR